MEVPTATPTTSSPRLTAAERDLILGAVRGQDPNLVASLIESNLDVSSLAIAKASTTLNAEQRARLKSVRFEELLMEGETLANTDGEFAKRWKVIMRPKGRDWLKSNLKRIQAGL